MATAKLGEEDWLIKALHSLEYCDLQVKCGERQFPVHKAVVCPMSQWFARATQGPFSEAFSGVIELQEDDPAVVAVLLDLMYHKQKVFDPIRLKDIETLFRRVCELLEVARLADKYMVERLLVFLRQRIDDLLRHLVRKWPGEFVEIFIGYVLHTDKALPKDIAASIQDLFSYNRQRLIKTQMLQTYLKKQNSFAADLAVKFADDCGRVSLRCTNSSCAAKGQWAFQVGPEHIQDVRCIGCGNAGRKKHPTLDICIDGSFDLPQPWMMVACKNRDCPSDGIQWGYKAQLDSENHLPYCIYCGSPGTARTVNASLSPEDDLGLADYMAEDIPFAMEEIE